MSIKSHFNITWRIFTGIIVNLLSITLINVVGKQKKCLEKNFRKGLIHFG